MRITIAYLRRHHLALVALLFALGGTTAYAADKIDGSKIRNKSIAGKKLRNNTVTGKQIKEKSLRCKWIHGCGKRGPKGQRGPKGAKGAKGATGAPGAVGAIGPVGPRGAGGPPGADGPQGEIGPQGPPGTDGLEDPLLASRDGLELEETTEFDEWTVVPGVEGNGFDPETGVFTAPQDGTYMVAVGADGGPVGSGTISVGSGDGPYELGILENGFQLDQRSFPMIDVNVVSVLTLRAPLSDAAVQLTEAIPLQAGDELSFQIDDNGLGSASGAASFDADLFIARLAG